MEQANNILTNELQQCLSTLERERRERESRIEAAAKIKQEIEEQRKHLTSSF